MSSALDIDRTRALNPLLLLPTDGNSPSLDYNCNLSDDDLYNDNAISDNLPLLNNESDNTHTNESVDENDIHENDLIDDIIITGDKASFKSTSAATHQFQVLLHDLMMKHRTSLQLFDDICSLVNNYTSSPDFSMTSKIPNRKAFLFLRSIEHVHHTHRLQPTNMNVRLHDNSWVTVPIFDTKQMIISLLTDYHR